MPRHVRFLLLAVALLAFFGVRFLLARHEPARADSASARANTTERAPPRMYGRIAFRPCTLSSTLGGGNTEAQCGRLDVAENPARPAGRKLALHLAWVPAQEGQAQAEDPVFLLAGGPGQSATESYPQAAAAFREVLKHRNVILVDQRGTGQSNPLPCPGIADESLLGDDDAAAAEILARVVRCRDRLSRRADLRFYTTSDAVGDLDAVRDALQVAKIDLLGVSYGTRVAQQYARRYPQRTRALVLDSVVPNTIFLGNDFARNLESALDLQFGRCGATPGCAKALGDPRQRLNALMTRLKSEPPRVRYRDAGTGVMKEETLTTGHVAALARMYAYTPAVASILPLLLNEGAHGRYDNLMALSKMLLGDLGDQLAYGMQLSVICSEDAEGLTRDPGMSGSLLGNELVGALIAQCAQWPKGARPADFHQPLKTDVPTLLLAGELDPVTPPAYAHEAAHALRNGRVLVLRGQGHNVIGAGCMPKLFAQFLDTADAKALDAKCLDTLAYTPPFTSFNGWSP